MLISAATGGDRALGPFLEMDLDGYQVRRTQSLYTVESELEPSHGPRVGPLVAGASTLTRTYVLAPIARRGPANCLV